MRICSIILSKCRCDILRPTGGNRIERLESDSISILIVMNVFVRASSYEKYATRWKVLLLQVEHLPPIVCGGQVEYRAQIAYLIYRECDADRSGWDRIRGGSITHYFFEVQLLIITGKRINYSQLLIFYHCWYKPGMNLNMDLISNIAQFVEINVTILI